MTSPFFRACFKATSQSVGIVLLVGGLLLGCDDSSPTGPEEASFVFAGEVKSQSSTEDLMTLLDTRTVRVELVDLSAQLIDLASAEALNLTVGLGLGQPDSTGACGLTFQQAIREGDFFVFRLTEGTYCWSMFDPGLWPPDATIAFGLAVEIE